MNSHFALLRFMSNGRWRYLLWWFPIIVQISLFKLNRSKLKFYTQQQPTTEWGERERSADSDAFVSDGSFQEQRVPLLVQQILKQVSFSMCFSMYLITYLSVLQGLLENLLNSQHLEVIKLKTVTAVSAITWISLLEFHIMEFDGTAYLHTTHSLRDLYVGLSPTVACRLWLVGWCVHKWPLASQQPYKRLSM